MHRVLIQTGMVCLPWKASDGALPCLSALYTHKTSAGVTDGAQTHQNWRRERFWSHFWVIFSAYVTLIPFSMPVSSGAWVHMCLYAWLQQPNHSSVHFFAMNKTPPASDFHHTHWARDENQGTRQGSAQCMIWTALPCLHRGFYYRPEEEEAKSLYRINNILVRFQQDVGWWRKQILSRKRTELYLKSNEKKK